MKLRRYSVTVMDNWTTTRDFFTLAAALRMYDHHASAHLYRWTGRTWVEWDFSHRRSRR
jgi:hypothetical protein